MPLCPQIFPLITRAIYISIRLNPVSGHKLKIRRRIAHYLPRLSQYNFRLLSEDPANMLVTKLRGAQWGVAPGNYQGSQTSKPCRARARAYESTGKESPHECPPILNSCPNVRTRNPLSTFENVLWVHWGEKGRKERSPDTTLHSSSITDISTNFSTLP